jgi:hypothetical protein
MCRFRTLWLVGLLASVGIAGCDDDGDGEGGGLQPGQADAQMFLRWSVGYLPETDPNGPLHEVGCDAVKATTVFLEARPVSGGTPFTQTFPCRDQMGWTDSLPPGRYRVYLSLRDAKGTTLSFFSDPTPGWTVQRGRATTFDDMPFEFPIQVLPLQWDVLKAGKPALCAEVGATEVLMIAASEQTGMIMELQQRFPCAPTGTRVASDPVQQGRYAVTLRLLNASGMVLSEQRQVVDVPAETLPRLQTFKFDVP